MPVIEISADPAAATVTRERLRTFYLAGKGLDALHCDGPLRPAALDSAALPRMERHYPLYLSASGLAQPLFDVIRAIVEAAPDRYPVLRDALELAAGAFGEHAAITGCCAIEAAIEPSLSQIAGRLELLHADPQQVRQDCDAIRRALPIEGLLIAFGPQAPVILSCALLAADRTGPRAAFANQLHFAAQRLEELLTADKRSAAGSASAERIGTSLGQTASAYLKADAIAEAVARRAQPVKPLEAERRARCQKALTVLYSALAHLERLPMVLLIHSGPGSAGLGALSVRQHPAPDATTASACEYALDLASDQVDQFVSVWKAMRVARLEADSAFDPAIHEEALDAFDWSMAHPEELAALPAFVVSDTAANIEASLGAFDRILRSGLPIQVIVSSPSALTSDLPDLPLSWQDTFAVHTSLAAPAHMAAGLLAMSRVFAPAVAVVAGGNSWQAAAAQTLARAFPLYTYNPDAGEMWSQRLTFEPVPASGLFPLHAAALDAACGASFRLLPATTKKVGTTELVEFPSPRPAHGFHYVAVTTQSGDAAHAIFTRQLADRSAQAERRYHLLAALAAPPGPSVPIVDADVESRARAYGAAQAVQQAIAILASREIAG